MSGTPRRELDFLERAGLVLLALQLAIFAQLVIATGFDRASDGYPIMVMCTGLFIASQRRLVAKPPNRGAASWVLASRTVVLAMLTLATLTIAFYRLVPEAGAAPELVPRGLFALLWVIIALKGAGIGKLKPGSGMGLRVSWTKESRLAWDRGHRALGRVLFWSGLIGLATSLIVAPLTSLGLWTASIALAVTTGLIESWRTWRLDPHRA